MKSIYIHLACLFSVCLFISCAFNQTKESINISLWDGASMNGWEGDMSMFRIEDGAIKAGTLQKEIPHNYFLCTEKRYGDFELTIQAKAVGDFVNAGIQFRSERIADHHEVIGYQCDIGQDQNGPIWGFLYDESRRRKFLYISHKEAVKNALNPTDWNELKIMAKDKNIQTFLNDQLVVDYIEEDKTIWDSGIICLQIHSGPPAETWYKDIEISML